MTGLDKSEREVYELLKQRVNVEQAFDVLKNTLNADRTYMREITPLKDDSSSTS